MDVGYIVRQYQIRMEDMAALDMASKFSVFFVPIRIGGVSNDACPQKLESSENMHEQ